VLDGEVVVVRHGSPDLDAVSGRLATRRLADCAGHVHAVTFVAFDVLELRLAPHRGALPGEEGSARELGLGRRQGALTVRRGR